MELNRDELAYYARHLLLPSVGFDGQRKLKAARVLVVGAGGLGCPALQALAGSGIGLVTVMDGDVVSLSNLSRQWLHRVVDCGQNKAESAKRALSELNPHIQIEALPTHFSQSNAATLVAAHDLVIDATDDMDARYEIDDACGALDRPWVHAALYRERAQLTTFWARTDTSFRSLYPNRGTAPSCAGAGMLGANASIAGHFEALEAIKLITGHGIPAFGKLVSIDGNGHSIQSFVSPRIVVPQPIMSRSGEIDSRLFTCEQLKQAQSIHESVSLIDLRTQNERSAHPLSGATVISETELLERGLPPFPGKTVLVCQTGTVSVLLAHALSQGDAKVFYLENGMEFFSAFT